ncbi:MAG TPA: glycosyltransferase family 4 protein [Phnomibacter sp.]|nr:glycosyltransferase family 4 protein [Phnomibacter sp.]
MIAKVRDRLLLFWHTNKWMALLQAIAAKLNRQKIVVFNKYHPIYTDFFFGEKMGPIKWVFVKNDWVESLPARWMIKMANAFHIDASCYNKSFENSAKPLIVECEGTAQGAYWKNSAVKALYFQSRYAGRMQLGQDETRLLYPAINANRSFKDLRRKEGITLLTVGHGGFIKGIDISYAVYKELKKRGYNTRLVIAGSLGHNFDLYPEVSKEAYAEAGFEQMEKEMLADPGVVLRPFRRWELLNEIYPSTNVLLHFSRMETFGFTILEDISFGIPVVSVKFKAIPEMVDHGFNGFLCNPFNWDGASPLDELCMNTPAWKEKCIAEGVEYVEAILRDDKLEETMRKNAFEKARQFDFSIRHLELSRMYNTGI